MRHKFLPIAVLSIICLLVPSSFKTYEAHSGRTDSEGCHNNRSTGDYHCHNNGTASTTSNQAKPLERPGSTTSNDTYWRVSSVGDGDTLRIAKGEETVTVRLGCIDAPEMAQDYGPDAKEQLQALLPVGTPISMRTIDTDRYGRTVAEVFSAGRNINLSMLKSGHAVAYRRYLNNCDRTVYLEAEGSAQDEGLVFWSLDNPVMPWEFRQQSVR